MLQLPHRTGEWAAFGSLWVVLCKAGYDTCAITLQAHYHTLSNIYYYSSGTLQSIFGQSKALLPPDTTHKEDGMLCDTLCAFQKLLTILTQLRT